MDSFLVVSVLVGSGLCSVEHTPEDSILVANTNTCEECSVSVDIDIDKVVPVHSLTLCLWLKPSYFYRSTAAFSIWSENQKTILTVSVQDNIIEVSGVTSEIFPLTQITIGEWVHLCILYGPFLFVTLAVPGEDAPPQVFEFHTLLLNIQNGSKVIAVVGANQEEYHPLFGRFADIRIYWRLLGQEELAKLFRFEAFSDDFISVLDLIANDPSDPNVVVGDAIDKIDKFGLVEGEGARKAVSLNRIMVSSILKPRVEHFHWYFSKKVSCNDGKVLCTRFGGIIINSIGDAMCRNLLDEFKKGEGDSGSFWILSSRATCKKGRYKNDNLFTSDTNVTDKLSTICLLSKKQNFYFHDGNSILTFLAVPDHNALFKSQQDYSILKYDAEQKKAYIKTLLDNSPFEEAAIENEIRLMGRHNWTSNSGDRRNRRAIFSICTRGQFTCSNGDCIDMTKVCNDLKDCADESDEEFCEIGINPIGFYDRRGAPLINDGLFTKVSLNILLVRVGLIDMDSHTISLNLIVTAKWRDPRLKFKYLEENKTMLIGHDISRKFWSPKITMTTAISSDKQLFDMNKYPGPMYAVSSDQPKLEVFDGYEAFIFDGDKVDIIHEKSESVTFLCDMDLFLFPFDYQKCNITFVLESLLNPDALWNPEAIGVRVRQRRDPTLYNSLGFFLPGPVPNDTHEVPSTENGWKDVAQEFEDRWNFHNCVGSVDGKHVTIKKPANSGSYFFNYKGTFSIVLMAIVDANYPFMMVDVGANGRVSDGGVLKNTVFWQKLSGKSLNIPDSRELQGTDKKFPFVFVGDEAFQLLPNFMKPYSRAMLTDERRIFNYRLSRARRVVENVFGILTSRFKIFQKDITFEPNKARKIVMACGHLHNYLCMRNKENYLQVSDVDNEDCSTGAIVPASWRQDTTHMTQLKKIKYNPTLHAKEVRDDFCTFFNTSGSVSWQNKCLYN